MRKTNIRINGKFLAKEDGNYYLSDIDEYDDWIKLEEIPKYDNVTEEYKKLSKEYHITKKVNFIKEQSGGWPSLFKKEQSGGGWPSLFKKEQSGGGWKQSQSSNMQSGGWGPPPAKK